MQRNTRKNHLKPISYILSSFLLFISCHSIALAMGGQIGLEFAIDAPWRLEPIQKKQGGYAYGGVPITITFQDVIFDDYDNAVNNFLTGIDRVHVGTLESITVEERVANGSNNNSVIKTTYNKKLMKEIERKNWISTKNYEPPHQLCKPREEDCDPLIYKISETHAWHAMFWYYPRFPVAPGRDIHLRVTVNTKQGDKRKEFTNYLVVHAGEAPLPRFSRDWLYGDLHYHSQMTDNEGESGYSYRNVIKTLGALGIDFVFATDHASGGVQKLGGGITVGREKTPSGAPGKACKLGNFGQPIDPTTCKRFSGTEARDLNATRFQAAKKILYGENGANEDIANEVAPGNINIANYLTRKVLPQVYMGEELDSIPEMSIAEFNNGSINYGDQMKYLWSNPNNCIAAVMYSPPGSNEDFAKKTCREKYSKPYSQSNKRSYLVRDKQGGPVFYSNSFSRQHLVYFPWNSEPNGRGWVDDNTGKYGGATRRLEKLIADIERNGMAFLAHPLINRTPGSKNGPDMIPYSDSALNRAWASENIIGLQFWNEDDRLVSKAQDGDGFMSIKKDSRVERYDWYIPWNKDEHALRGKFPWKWQKSKYKPTGQTEMYEELYHSAFTWDRYLRKGVTPSEIRKLGWLEEGNPRKWFMAGGSDSHGDFNYRRHGRPDLRRRGGNQCQDQWCDNSVGDTAIGKPRNLVLVGKKPKGRVLSQLPKAKRYTNKQVLGALKKGKFSVTDGPAIRIAIDKNRNGRIDKADYQMGSDFHLSPGEHIPLLVEWQSTKEFGPAGQVNIYFGNKSETYAADYHGPNNKRTKIPGATYSVDPTDSHVLEISLKKGVGYHGLAKLFLSPKQFNINKHGDMFYIRAFVMTGYDDCPTDKLLPTSCGQRFGYTNPVWGRLRLDCNSDTKRIDKDGNEIADICEAKIVNPCKRNEDESPIVAPPIAQPQGAQGGLDQLRPGGLYVAVAPQVAIAPGQTGSNRLRPPTQSCQFVNSIIDKPKVMEDIQEDMEIIH